MTHASGVVIVDKPSGITSHQVVGRLRRLLGTRKIGHAGTLDPMATGVLILGVNRATRLLGHLALHDKRYLATVRLGESSPTDDADGDVSAVADASLLTMVQVDEALEPMRGDILQVPSTVSAIKVDGKRAYALARAGESVELKARPVTVSGIWERPAASAGTSRRSGAPASGSTASATPSSSATSPRSSCPWPRLRVSASRWWT